MNHLDADEIHMHLESLQRTPFRELLAEYLDCKPDRDSIQSFANDYPDRYANAVKNLAALSGYQDTVTHEHNYLVEIRNMSDSAIEARMRELKTIEGEIDDHKDVRPHQQLSTHLPGTTVGRGEGDAEEPVARVEDDDHITGE